MVWEEGTCGDKGRSMTWLDVVMRSQQATHADDPQLKPRDAKKIPSAFNVLMPILGETRELARRLIASYEDAPCNFFLPYVVSLFLLSFMIYFLLSFFPTKGEKGAQVIIYISVQCFPLKLYVVLALFDKQYPAGSLPYRAFVCLYDEKGARGMKKHEDNAPFCTILVMLGQGDESADTALRFTGYPPKAMEQGEVVAFRRIEHEVPIVKRTQYRLTFNIFY